MKETENNLQSYFDWFKKRYTVNELKNADEIVTPFSNHLNDRISIFVEYLKNDEIKLSDDGITIDELLMSGINLKTKTRQKIMKDILKRYGLSLTNETIYVIAENSSHFPQQQHNLLQGILSIYDILFTTKENTINIFNEDVHEFLFENDFGGTSDVKLSGKSGLIHQIDYSLGATKRRPLTLVKFLNSPAFKDVAAQKFISDDLRQNLVTSKFSYKYVIIANDNKNNIPQKSLTASKEIGIDLIPWSKKSDILSLR